MLAVKLLSENRPADQGPRHVVIISETRPRELDEPRHLIRRAIAAAKAGRAARRKPSVTAMKVNSLILTAALRAKAIVAWSRARTYDPLPDFLELRDVATRRLSPSAAVDCPIAACLAALDDSISQFESVSAAQRLGIA